MTPGYDEERRERRCNGRGGYCWSLSDVRHHLGTYRESGERKGLTGLPTPNRMRVL